jgi:uncharacterized membrane protein YhaH (DUF805 family)
MRSTNIFDVGADNGGEGARSEGRIAALVSSMREVSLFSFQGRIGRRDYWIAVGWAHLALIGSVIPRMLQSMLVGYPSTRIDFLGRVLGLSLAAVALGVVLFYFWLLSAALVKRLHDLNLSGWIAPVLLISVIFARVLSERLLGAVSVIFLVGIAFLVVLGAAKGTRGPNRFGADPLAVVHSDIFGKSAAS